MTTFSQIPSNLRTPAQLAEFDSSQASQGPALLPYRALLIGQKTSAGTATANTLHRVTSADQVATLAGRGSLLHRQAIAWFAVNTQTETWIGVLADNGAGVAATGSFTFADEDPSAPGADAGTVALYIGGERVEVGIDVGDDEDDAAAAAADAINANPDLPVTALATNGAVALTYRHKGLVGNMLDLRHSARDGEAVPAGLTLAVGAMANGTTAPALSDLLAAAAATWFHVVVHPYTDSSSLDAIEDEMADRATALRAIDGLAITSAGGTHGALTSLGGARNAAYSMIVAQPGKSPLTPSYEFAAEVAGVMAIAAAADPARPFQTLGLRRALPPADADLFTQSERNQLLWDGISTAKVGPGGVVQIERAITTYQLNAAGAPDEAYLDATTIFTLMYLRYSWVVRLATRYPRHKLASDGVRLGPGQAVMTPKLGKAEALFWFKDMEELGLVENYAQFKRDLLADRNLSDPNRMDWRLPPDLINAFIVGATQIAFRR